MTVQALGCHRGCAVVIGTQHRAEINPVNFDVPGLFEGKWRAECSDCGTVLRILDTRDDALACAVLHAHNNVREDR